MGMGERENGQTLVLSPPVIPKKSPPTDLGSYIFCNSDPILFKKVTEKGGLPTGDCGQVVISVSTLPDPRLFSRMHLKGED
jgi:hypothetical protein